MALIGDPDRYISKMKKINQYLELVKYRKSFHFSDGLLNPNHIAHGEFDKKDHIGPWSIWQGNLDAKILLIGQDFSDEKYYIHNEGIDSDDNITNINLAELFSVIGIKVGSPLNPITNYPLFFTNCILGIKSNGGMAGQVKMTSARECTKSFLSPLIGIIEPKILITLGKLAYDSLAEIYKLKKHPMKKLIKLNPIQLHDGKILYAMYHCGGLGTANRKLDLQKQDWKIIKKI